MNLAGQIIIWKKLYAGLRGSENFTFYDLELIHKVAQPSTILPPGIIGIKEERSTQEEGATSLV